MWIHVLSLLASLKLLRELILLELAALDLEYTSRSSSLRHRCRTHLDHLLVLFLLWQLREQLALERQGSRKSAKEPPKTHWWGRAGEFLLVVCVH